MKRKKAIKGLAVGFAVVATLVGGFSLIASLFTRPMKNKEINFHEKND